ncbi:hypothetical protein GCM10028784_17070 [Myceligenerans cantabricum]
MADERTGGAEHARPDVWELIPGYALEALDEPERRAVDKLLGTDAGARRALDEYRDVVAAFAAEAEPPASLRARVLEQVWSLSQASAPGAAGTSSAAGTPWVSGVPSGAGPSPGASPAGGEVVGLDAFRRRRRRWGLAVAAAAAAAAIAVPTTIAVRTTAEVDRLRTQAQAVSEMLGDPDSAILRKAVDGGGEASVLVAGDDMLFRADGLPELGPDQAYQLWVVAADGSVSSAGLLALEGDHATSLVRESDGVGMAVSVEPGSGSQQPTSAPIVVLGA